VKSFTTYLTFLLPKPLRKPDPAVTDIKRLAQVLGGLLDEAMESVFQVRRCWFPGACPDGEAIDLHGDERDIIRLPGESHNDYRARVMAAFETYLAGGTVPGIVMAMDLLGHPGATVQEPRTRYRHDGRLRRDGSARWCGVQWATFTVTLPWVDALKATHVADVVRQINRWKAAWTRLGGIVLDQSTAPASWSDAVVLAEDLEVVAGVGDALGDSTAMGRARHDGRHQHDGSVQYNGDTDVLELEIVPA